VTALRALARARKDVDDTAFLATPPEIIKALPPIMEKKLQKKRERERRQKQKKAG
jgi:hypothetical protein